MTAATNAGPTAEEMDYNLPVTAAAFPATGFVSLPSGLRSTAVAQIGPNVLSVTFPVGIALDTTVRFDAFSPGVISPQTIAII